MRSFRSAEREVRPNRLEKRGRVRIVIKERYESPLMDLTHLEGDIITASCGDDIPLDEWELPIARP